MKIQRLGSSWRLVLAGAAVAGLAACATAQPEAASRPVVKQVEADPAAAAAAVTPPAAPAAAPASAAPASTVAELQELIQRREVAELRTTYNGSYGASLLFKADDLTYYVALFQQRDFWRVIKTDSRGQAEAAYRGFAARSAELAEVDLKRIRLQAEYAHAEKQLAARTAQLSVLQADQSLRQQQEQQVAARQARLRDETASLSEQRQDVRAQLRALQRQIDALRAEQRRISTPVKPAAQTRSTGGAAKAK